MFIGYYKLENEQECFAIYYKNKLGYNEWNKDTFCPYCHNIRTLDFKISGKNYQERQASLRDLAIDYSNNFAGLSWSYSELAEIGDYFYKNGKRYGLLKEFKKNCIC